MMSSGLGVVAATGSPAGLQQPNSSSMTLHVVEVGGDSTPTGMGVGLESSVLASDGAALGGAHLMAPSGSAKQISHTSRAIDGGVLEGQARHDDSENNASSTSGSLGFSTDLLPPNTTNSHGATDPSSYSDDDGKAEVDPNVLPEDDGATVILDEEEDDWEDLFNNDYLK
ncbi:hypothetical protein ZWY2020_006361 [Hordeum vulgare]|nr:hypothetical protein ZWY2020_006361 [Hordeum vulgare]